jgi:urea transport system ATP-binding protein
VVIGPNGAGKTTVLDLICGKTRATGGSIKFDGQELTKMREYNIVRAGVGRKFQTRRSTRTSRCSRTSRCLPGRAQGFGALFFKRSAQVIARVEEVAGRSSWRLAATTGRPALARPEAVAGDRHAADAGPELLMLDEPVAGMSVASARKPPSCSTASARAVRCW